MFTAALFTTAKTWKKLECPSTDKRTKKMWYTYTKEYYPSMNQNQITPFAATWMGLEVIILN